jgi:hypothetical protein
MHASTQFNSSDDLPNCLEPLVHLPGAQAISTDALAHAMQLSFDLHVPYMCVPLLELQNATKAPSAKLCRLVADALRFVMPELAVDICTRYEPASVNGPLYRDSAN